jgi:aminoglycoside phosphotransferase family enzyme/predicted kinase
MTMPIPNSVAAAPPADLPGFAADDLPSLRFPHPVERLELRETPLSWIVLTGPFAYKIKKAVRLEFIDTSSLDQRRRLCDEELRLNRRLAAEIYLDVVPLTRDPGGLHMDGKGSAVDYAVRMRQFDTAQELPALLQNGTVRPAEIVDLALRLAEFHLQAPSAPRDDHCPCTQNLSNAVLGNLATLLSHLDAASLTPELGPLIDWTHDCLRSSREALRLREQDGAVRECHGDLHARNIARWAGRLVPFDCLEFDPKLRWIDRMNDVAFLVMDLRAYGRNDLACGFLDAYVERTGDAGGLRHLPFFAVYRSLVRAMVDSLAGDRSRLRSRIATAYGYLAPPRPALVLMHGLTGSGKSWLSERLVTSLPAIRFRSDVERKRLAGPTLHAARGRFGHGLYCPAITRRTYERLLDCADSALQGGLNTIIDASFPARADRRTFRVLAERHSAAFTILACEADDATRIRHLAERRRRGTDASDADVAILVQQHRIAETLDADELTSTVFIDMTAPSAPDDALAAIRQPAEPISASGTSA